MLTRTVFILFFITSLLFAGLDVYRHEYFYLMFDVLLAVTTGLLFKLFGDFEKNKEMFR